MEPTTPADLEVMVEGRGLFEAPTWDGAGGLFFTNVTEGGAFRLDVSTRVVNCVAPHRKGMGGLALTEDEGFVVSGRNIALKHAGDPNTETLAEGAARDPALRGYNDLTVAPDGAIIAGALGVGALSPHTLTGREPAPPDGAGTGTIWRITGRSTDLLADDIGHPNGIAISTDGRTAYVSDTLRRVVYRYRTDGETWSERKIFATFPDGQPDGLALAEDGSVWLALALAGKLVVLSPEGAVTAAYRMPTPLVTSLCFGGANRRSAYVTTGAHGGRDPAYVLRFLSPVAGIAVPRAKPERPVMDP